MITEATPTRLGRSGWLLVVEDSDDDFEALGRCSAEVPGAPFLHRSLSGEECLAHLTSLRGDPASLPDVILLDLNLPGMTGHELLSTLKTDPVLCSVPVVVLSTSSRPDDVNNCYRSHASAYHVKASDLRTFRTQIRDLFHYWLDVVVCPRHALPS